jgi:hypothetical protein
MADWFLNSKFQTAGVEPNASSLLQAVVQMRAAVLKFEQRSASLPSR